MFGKIARYVRKKRSRVRVEEHRVALLADGPETQHIYLKTQDIHQDAVVANLDKDPSPVDVHSLHRSSSLKYRTDALDDSYHDGTALEVDAPIHTQEVPIPEQEDSAGEDPIVDSLTLGRMWNSFASINALPDEVLVEVFLCTRLKRRMFDKDISPVEPTRYMVVCRRWRDVIVSHACFWRTIVVEKRTEWLRLALPRSCQAMLHLEFDDLPTLASVLSDVIPHRDRIRTLELGYHPRYDGFMTVSPLIAAHFQSLTKLTINTSTWYRPDASYFVLLPEHYPQLTHLDLKGIHIQWTVPLLAQLTTLSLTNCSIWPSHMDGNTFLDVLHHAQRLESLKIDGFISASCSVIPSRSRCSLFLPRLRDLDITDSARWVQQFTTFVRAPFRSGRVKLHGQVNIGDLDNTPISHQGLLLPPDIHFHPKPGTTLHVLVLVSRDSTNFTLVCSDSAVHTSLTLCLPKDTILSSNTILASVKSILDPSTLQSLVLDIPMHNVDRDALDAYLDASPHLRTLHIGLCTSLGGTHHPLPLCIFDSLAARTRALDKDESDASRVRLRCPMLKLLYLGGLAWDGGAVMDAALDCLRIRAALDTPQLDFLDICVLPRPPEGGSKRLRTADLDLWYAEQLQKMVTYTFSFSVAGT